MVLKNTTKNTILFVLILLGIFYGLELIAREMYSSESSAPRHLKNLVRRSGEIEILLTGNSQMLSGLSCGFLEMNCYNAAIGAQDLYYMAKALEGRLAVMPKLKIVVINLSIFSFGLDTSYDTRYLAKDYYHELGILPRSDAYLNLALASSIFYLHRRTFAQDLFRGRRADDKTDSGPSLSQAETAQLAARSHFSAHGAILPHNVESLDSLLGLLRQKKIAVYLVTFPSHPMYLAAYPFTGKLQFYLALEGLLRNHPEVKFLDYSNWSGLLDEDFAKDSFHLSASGTKKMSNHFALSLFLGSSFKELVL